MGAGNWKRSKEGGTERERRRVFEWDVDATGPLDSRV